MRSVKDLLKALQFAQAIPHNVIAMTTTEATSLVQPHQYVAGTFLSCDTPSASDLMLTGNEKETLDTSQINASRVYH